jgi:cell division protein FtsB
MGPFEMVVLIVAISVGAGVYTTYLKSKASNSVQNADIDSLRADVQRLTARVKSLETLATDPESRLKAEIDQLK